MLAAKKKKAPFSLLLTNPGSNPPALWVRSHRTTITFMQINDTCPPFDEWNLYEVHTRIWSENERRQAVFSLCARIWFTARVSLQLWDLGHAHQSCAAVSGYSHKNRTALQRVHHAGLVRNEGKIPPKNIRWFLIIFEKKTFLVRTA